MASETTAGSTRCDVVVVGSSNVDLIAYVPRLPRIGETLHGSSFEQGCGGKGANQAVMCGKLGGSVAMVSKVGTDVFGKQYIENYKRLGVCTDAVLETEEASTGVALISVDPDGNNSIVIVPGANNLLTPAEVEAHADLICNAKVVVCQFEILTETSLAALRLAKSRGTGVVTILNPAPAPDSLPDGFYEVVDIFCPNETEAETLTGIPVKGRDGAEEACRELLKRGFGTVIITIGADGAMLAVKGEEPQMIPSTKVDTVVDTVGAGDSFVGALAYFISRGDVALPEAVRRSCAIASDSVQKRGTQTSYATRDELPAELFAPAP